MRSQATPQRGVLLGACVLVAILAALAVGLSPSPPDRYMAIFSAVQAIVTVMTVGLAAYVFVGQREQTNASLELAREQVGLTREGLLADHTRRKKQATLEYIGAMLETTREARRTLHEWLGNENLSREQARELRSTIALLSMRRCVREVLNEFERLAAGAREDIYDREVIRSLVQGIAMRLHERVGQFILVAQVDEEGLTPMSTSCGWCTKC